MISTKFITSYASRINIFAVGLLSHCIISCCQCVLVEDEEKTSPSKSTPKKVKVEAYKLTKEQKALIKEDELNKKLWDEAMESLSLGPVCTTFKF